MFRLMLLVLVTYSVQLDHIVQLPPADLIAVVGTKIFPIIGYLATLSNVLLASCNLVLFFESYFDRICKDFYV